ncbi:MAG: hypothetical protein ACRDY7_03890 [Acidimicrobiia bacterium]
MATNRARIGSITFEVGPEMTTIEYPEGTSGIRTSQVFRGFVRMLDWMRGFDAFRMEGDFTITEVEGGLFWEFGFAQLHADSTRTPYAERFPMGEAADFCRWVANLAAPHTTNGHLSPVGRLPQPGEFSEHYIIDRVPAAR